MVTASRARCVPSALVLVTTGGDGIDIIVISESRWIQSQRTMLRARFIHQIYHACLVAGTGLEVPVCQADVLTTTLTIT